MSLFAHPRCQACVLRGLNKQCLGACQMLTQWRGVQVPWQADGVVIHQGAKQAPMQHRGHGSHATSRLPESLLHLSTFLEPCPLAWTISGLHLLLLGEQEMPHLHPSELTLGTLEPRISNLFLQPPEWQGQPPWPVWPHNKTLPIHFSDDVRSR